MNAINNMSQNQTSHSKLFHRDFTLMVIGQIISLFGNATLRFALSMSVLDATGSASVFAAILAVSMIPTVLFSPFGGILADRVNRRNIMVGLDFFTSLSILAFTAAYHRTQSIAAIAVIMILLSVIQCFYQPSVQSSIPLLAGEEHLVAANGIVVQVNALAMLLGPVLGGVLFGFFGIYPILAVSAACFFASAVMECFLHIPFIRSGEKTGLFAIVKNDFSEAVRFLVNEQRPLLHLLLLLAGLNLFLSSMITVGMPYLIKIFLGLSNQLYGVADGALGLGSILGGLLSGLAAKKLKFSQAYIFLVGAAAVILPAGIAVLGSRYPIASWLVIMASMFAAICFATLFNVFAQTLMQRLTPNRLLGKVFSVVTVVSTCTYPLGQGMYGILFDRAGNRSFLVVFLCGIISVLLALGSKTLLKRIPDEICAG